MKHHTIVTGTGRAGTTFLVQLLTALGLDTGFVDITPDFPNCNAGLEWGLTHPNAPYIVKDPRLCETLDEILESHRDITIDRAIVPVRDLYAAAESRRDVERRTKEQFIGAVPGGLVQTEVPELQEVILAGQLYALMYTIAQYDIPLVLLHFPRIVHDPFYLYQKLEAVLGSIAYGEFLSAFEQVARPDRVHSFRQSEFE